MSDSIEQPGQELDILYKLAAALEYVDTKLAAQADNTFWLIIDRDWQPLSVEEFSCCNLLKARLLELKKELIAKLKEYADASLNIHVFQGRRFKLQHWPVWSLVSGTTTIVLDGSGLPDPVFSETGSLLAITPMVEPDAVASSAVELPVFEGEAQTSVPVVPENDEFIADGSDEEPELV